MHIFRLGYITHKKLIKMKIVMMMVGLRVVGRITSAHAAAHCFFSCVQVCEMQIRKMCCTGNPCEIVIQFSSTFGSFHILTKTKNLISSYK